MVVVPGVVASSKHVFGVRAAAAFRSPATRRLTVSLLGALALAILPTFSTTAPARVHVATTLAASASWLNRFNAWRASTGVPTLTENTVWSAGDYNHALYMVMDDLVTHYETPGNPNYTPAGDTAARNSNIYVSSSTATTDDQAIDWWMQAPFHAMGMMDPRLTQTGFGSYRQVKSGWDLGAAVDVLRGNPFTGGAYPVYFPGNGATEPLTSYGGGEYPNPLAGCPGYSAPTGLPVFIQVGGNVRTTAGPVHTFTGNGTALAHCVIDSNNSAVGSSLVGRGGVILIPQAPLQTGVRYVVTLSVNSVPYTWAFTVGPFFGVTSVSPSAGTASGGTTVTITGAGFSNVTTAVKFGATAATSFSVVDDATITAVTPTHAVGMVDVTVTTAAGTTPVNGADQFTYATPCTAVSGSAAPASPAKSGTQIAITGSSTCPSSNPLYEFWMQPAGSSTWQLVQGYSTNSTFNWNSIGALAGTETFGVWVRDANSPGIGSSSMGRYDMYASMPFTITTSAASACTSVTASPAPASPAASGTQVTITGSATNCPNPRYEFWARWQGSSAWQLLRGYSASATYTWNSTGALAGTENFGVWARDASSSASYDTYVGLPFTVTTQACTGVTASANPPSPSVHSTGVHVTITGAASGCPNANPVYEFWMKAAGSSTWQLVQGYSTKATYDWNSTGAPAGTETFGVWVRDASSTASYDTYASIPYTLT